MRKTIRFTISLCTLSTCLYAFSSTKGQSCPAYDYTNMQKENLGRGLVAIKSAADSTAISWRFFSSDADDAAFDVYKDGTKLNENPLQQSTFFFDTTPHDDKQHTYQLRIADTDSVLDSYTLKKNAPLGYLSIPLDKPEDGITPAGERYNYSANDASIGDVDGDGKYEIILKWEPSNAHDNSHDGYTGNVIFDCYTLDGKKLWRIDLGKNIRAGAHYTQFMVYDFDGDGKAEIVMKTADGTVDGKGNVIGNKNADYREKGSDPRPNLKDAKQGKREDKPFKGAPRNTPAGARPDNDMRRAHGGQPLTNQGRILTGPEYLTIFEGLTGKALATIDYVPPRGNIADWGDPRANRSDRFLAAVAYLDGKKPSVVMCRGYYTRSVLAAFDWDGKELKQKWVFDSNTPGNEDYAGQGNHNLRVADVDGDGCDEIIYGQCAIDHDGTGLYTTKMGHGDAIHLTAFFPNSDSLQVWCCHENKRDGSTFRDARTGRVIFQIRNNKDVGRCMAADVDPNNYGLEMWSSDGQTRRAEDGSKGVRNIKGEAVSTDQSSFSINSAVWWDGDLLRELLDYTTITKYDWETKTLKTLIEFEGTQSNNWTKANACLTGDIVGDWREEVILRTPESDELRIYVSPLPTDYRFHTFLEDIPYRISIATQNVAYNQPTQTGFYFGSDLEKGKRFRGSIIK